MIAGADEPATLSGFCQPMAKIAMAQKVEGSQARVGSVSLPLGLSRTDDDEVGRLLNHLNGDGCRGVSPVA